MSRRFGRNGRRIAYWTILAVLGGVLALVLSGCMKRDQSLGAVKTMKPSANSLFVLIDSDTGCQYLSAYAEAITPRIAADGKTHMGCKGAQL